jgi:excisionase family DNA binding protein
MQPTSGCLTSNEGYMTSQHFTLPLLTTEQAAEILGIKPTTLENWRCTKRVSIPYIRIGRTVRYRLIDIETLILASACHEK